MFKNLTVAGQAVSSFLLIIGFVLAIVILCFSIYLIYIRISNILMLHKWLKRQLAEEPVKPVETTKEQG